MEVLFAHSGHWITSVITVSPIGVIAIWLIIITLKDRKRGDEPEEALEEHL